MDNHGDQDPGQSDNETTFTDTIGRGLSQAVKGAGFYLWITAGFALGSTVVVGALGSFVSAFLVGGATFWGAGIIGFLFGIPRRSGESEALYRANTNLEDVSDWITKAVIGVGLVEIRQISGLASRAGHIIAEQLSNEALHHLFTALIYVEAACGFIFFYFWARVYMPKIFRDAEIQVLRLRTPDNARADSPAQDS